MAQADNLVARWYALHTRSRFEKVVAEGLRARRMEVFLPLHSVISRRRDRRKVIRAPLFPGYVFVRSDLDPRRHVAILRATGAVSLVGGTHGPVSVPDEQIESLAIMVAVRGREILAGDYALVAPGRPILVKTGPLAGVRGLFVRMKGAHRVVVRLDALGRFAAVEVAAEDVEIIR